MANSNTEHSKKLRAATAAAYNKRMIEEGKVKVVQLRIKTELVEQWDNVAKELNLSRPESIRYFLELYEKSR